MAWLPACRLEASLRRPILPVRIGGRDLLVVRDGEGTLRACERACPHEQADLALGRCAAGRIWCPRHAASFDLADGRISAGWTSPALRLYGVRVQDGEVLVEIG